MPDQPKSSGRQKARAGRDTSIAGRDQIIADHVVIAADSATDSAVPGLLPRDVTSFTGRAEELAQLAKLTTGGRVVVSAIGGTAGVGKTALAVHAAHRLLPQFPDGHLYADLHGYTEGQEPVEPHEVLEVFLRRLGVPTEEIPVTTEERSGLLRQVLASRRVLMVLDNARSEGQVRPLLPGAGGSLVLVTSRSMLPGLEADTRISLDVLSEAEAVTMLAGIIGEGRAAGEPEAVMELMELCGRLPLALRIAGQVLATRPSWPVAKMTRLLVDQQNRLGRLGAGDLRVRTAFEVSYGLLEAGDARLFRLLGLNPGPDFTVATAAALAGIEDEPAESVLGRLAEAHLVSEDESGRFKLHDLLRLFAHATCQDTDSEADQEAAEARLVDYYVRLAEFLDSCVNPWLRSATPEADQAGMVHPSMREALALLQAERSGLTAAVGLAAQRSWDEQVRQISVSAAEALSILNYLDDLVTIVEAALAASRRVGDTRAEAVALGSLGIAYRMLRRSEEAVSCLQQALAILRETGDRRSEGMVLNNLGNAYSDLRRFDEAISCLEQDVAICQETGDRLGEGMTLSNLGITYADSRRFEEAVGCLQQALAIYREAGDRYGEGQTLSNLGSVYQDMRRFEEAVGCLQQGLPIARETGDRLGEGQTLSNLGAVYQDMRRFEEAVGCLQQALAIYREADDQYGEGQTLANLGNVYAESQQHERAVMYWREAAAAMHSAGDYETAKSLEQQAARVQSRRRRWWRRGSRSVKI
jgi:tetratricopeptide (TPR) repeat protein